MSLLEVITKASVNSNNLTFESSYPIILNPDPILLSLKPQNEDINEISPIKRVEGWKILQMDADVIELGQKFFKKLKRKMKNHSTFNKDEFMGMLTSHLEKSSEKVGICIGVDKSEENYTAKLIEKVGFLMGREVKGLILEAGTLLELWELLETLIICGLVEYSCSSNLIYNLIEKGRSDLICLCIKHLSDLQTCDILSIMRYFLSPNNGSFSSMVSVRKDWESQALLAMEKAADKKLKAKKLNLAKEASVLLMLAHDGFSDSELCLHYLFASSNLDEVILSSCISKLNGSEMMSLIQYLGKWLWKYERFPQAGPCPKACSTMGLKACEWIPTLENVVKCLGLVLDEHFSSLILHAEFHEELRSIEELVNSLTSEARVCCSIMNVIETLRTEVED